MRLEKQNTLIVILFAVYILLLTSIIIFKLPFYSPKISDGIRVVNFIPLIGSFNGNGVLLWREIIQNILIFIPLGIYISMFRNTWIFMKKTFMIFSLSLSFETIQFIFALGRTDITDILNNTLGGIIGIGIYNLFFKVFKNKTVNILNMLTLAVTVFIVLRFSYLFYLSHFLMR